MELKPYSHYGFHLGMNTIGWNYTIIVSPLCWRFAVWRFNNPQAAMFQIGPFKFITSKNTPCAGCEAHAKAKAERKRNV